MVKLPNMGSDPDLEKKILGLFGISRTVNEVHGYSKDSNMKQSRVFR